MIKSGSDVGSKAGPAGITAVHTSSESKRVTEERREVMQQSIENPRGDALDVAMEVGTQEF